MRAILFSLSLFLVASGVSSAAIAYSSPSLSDDNGGGYIFGNTTTVVGPTFTLNLPNYQASNFDSNLANEVDLGISATSDNFIIALLYQITGNFTGLGSATFLQTATGGTNGAGTLNGSNSVISGSINDFAPTASINLTTQLNLADLGDLAGITQVQLTLVETPEPGTLGLAALGLSAAAWTTRRRHSRS